MEIYSNSINQIQQQQTHSEMSLAPDNMHASLVREKILQKIVSAKKATASEEGIQYVDIIFLINDKTIKQNVIKAFLLDKYRNQLSEINKDWKNILSEQKILEDVQTIKRKAVEHQWTQINICTKYMRQKEQRYKRYESSFKTKKQLNQRIKQLTDSLKITQNNINMCKKETQELKLREEYKQMKEQLRFLTNKSRKLRYLSQEKMINSSLSKSQEQLKQIYSRIQEISVEQKRIKDIQHLKYVKKQSARSSDGRHKRSDILLKKLEELFIEFSRKEVNQFMLFDDIMKTHKYMSLENYLRFVASSGIATQLSLDERVNIFKSVSKFYSKVSFLNFMDILKEICAKQCEKLKIPFKTSILDTFLEQMIIRLHNHKRKIPEDHILSSSNHFLKNLRSQVFSNYHFKVKSHTGKSKSDIQQYLNQKKQTKNNKTEPTIVLPGKLQRLTISKMTNIGQSLSRNGERTSSFNPDKKHIRRKLTNNFKTVNIHQNESTSESKSFKSSFEKDTYSSIFLKKRNMVRSQKKQQKINQDEEQSKRYTPEDSKVSIVESKKEAYMNTTPKAYDEILIKEEIYRQELKDIVQLDQDDPFLTNHLSMKYSIKINQPPSQLQKYHF